MTVIAQMPSDKYLDALNNGTVTDIKDMSRILYAYLMQFGKEAGFSDVPAHADDDENCFSDNDIRFSNGEVYKFDVDKENKADGEENKKKSVERFGYPSFPLNFDEEEKGEVFDNEEVAAEQGDTVKRSDASRQDADAKRSGKSEDGRKPRLEFSSEANDFFSEDGNVGVEASKRLRGIVLHNILSKVLVPEDLEKAIAESYNSGEIDEDERRQISNLLSSRVSDAVQRGWFPEERDCVFNETSVIDDEGETHRPDRVILKDGKVVIVDYKFGHYHGESAEKSREAYKKQIRKYADLYRRAGYENVSCYLWYVVPDEVVEA